MAESGLATIIGKTSETQSTPSAKLAGTLGTTDDSNGNPASLTFPDGRVLNYTYSARSQLNTVTGHQSYFHGRFGPRRWRSRCVVAMHLGLRPRLCWPRPLAVKSSLFCRWKDDRKKGVV